MAKNLKKMFSSECVNLEIVTVYGGPKVMKRNSSLFVHLNVAD